jgi:hypothetical protein
MATIKSIKEKAKAYDRAIEELRGLLECIHEDKCDIMEEDIIKIFPELKESEDERIRKELVQFFEEKDEEDFEEWIPKAKVLAWFEKQGEQKPNYCHHEVDLSGCSEEYRKAYYDGWNNCNMQHSQCKLELDDVVKCLINGMKFYYEDNEEATWGTDKWSMPVKHIIEVLEKQGEQKETLCDKCKKAQPSHSCQDITALGRCALEKQGEQKLTEFEKAVKQVMEEAIECGDTRNLKADADMLLSLIQKPAWSKEDEERQQSCLNTLQAKGIVGVTETVNSKWLKSLKGRMQPQSTWKPSDEQMDALHYVTNFDYGGHKATLVSLYEQLKKLKG